ncbi:MAG: deoxyribonuclease IV [Planctomycetota bacterium]|jgi:deoxyribonuclease-4
MIVGSHLSIAGGVDRALTAAGDYGFDTVALFVRNQRQWTSRPLADDAVRRFRAVRRRVGISPVVAHGSYLVNLAGAPDVRRKSIKALADELDRCGRLGADYLVIHPGSNPDRAKGMGLIAAALNDIMTACRHRRTMILLETTSRAGNTIGGRFEELAEILRRLRRKSRFGVCLDTCHIFAAGYDLRTPAVYRRTMAAFDDAVGLSALKAVHVNDSLGDLGSRRDRHAHIGCGAIGLKGFASLVNDPRLTDIPMIMETPKGENDSGEDWDTVNAAALRGLLKR